MSGPRVETIRSGPWGQNCYVVRDGDTAAVIDPGAALEAIERTLGDARLRWLLCTHGHYDHLGAAAALCARYGVPCHVHDRDRRLAGQAPIYAIGFERGSVAPPQDIAALAEGERFAVGATTLEVIETPGHTPGSVCFRADDVIFTGDTLLRERLGRTDLPGGDSAALRASIARLLEGREEGGILPGHGRTWNMAAARAWWGR